MQTKFVLVIHWCSTTRNVIPTRDPHVRVGLLAGRNERLRMTVEKMNLEKRPTLHHPIPHFICAARALWCRWQIGSQRLNCLLKSFPNLLWQFWAAWVMKINFIHYIHHSNQDRIDAPRLFDPIPLHSHWRRSGCSDLSKLCGRHHSGCNIRESPSTGRICPCSGCCRQVFIIILIIGAF